MLPQHSGPPSIERVTAWAELGIDSCPGNARPRRIVLVPGKRLTEGGLEKPSLDWFFLIVLTDYRNAVIAE